MQPTFPVNLAQETATTRCVSEQLFPLKLLAFLTADRPVFAFQLVKDETPKAAALPL